MPELAVPSRSGRRLPVGTAAACGGLATLALILCSVTTPASAAPATAATVPAAPPAAPPKTRCTVTDPRLPEISGLAIAGDHLLAVNDGGDDVSVYALDAACRVVDVRRAPINPYDPEDMALAADGTIWVADIGDNERSRPTVALLALRPDGTNALYRLSYPDGPHDAESLLLAPNGTPYIVTKDPLGTSGVYRPVSGLVEAGTVALARVGAVTFAVTGTAGGPIGQVGELTATGGAVSADGRLLALRTYTDAYVWPLSAADVTGALHEAAVRVPLPPSRQGEAIGFAADNRTLVVAGEGLPVDVTEVPTALPAAAATAAPGASAAPTARSPFTSAAIAAAFATLFVWLGGKFRRRRTP